MPYIKKERREPLWRAHDKYSTYPVLEVALIENPGELNFAITKMVTYYIQKKGLSYAVLNEVLGVLTAVTFELYRRLAVPYENAKMAENGDVYS